MIRRSCENCLWNWENLKTGKGRICYHNISPRYHQKAGGEACRAFETKVYIPREEVPQWLKGKFWTTLPSPK